MGTDFPTRDGTCVRDFIHVTDLVDAHLAVLPHVANPPVLYNVGTGKGVTVREFGDANVTVGVIPYAGLFGYAERADVSRPRRRESRVPSPQPGTSSHGGAKDWNVCIVSLRGSGFFAHAEPGGVVPTGTSAGSDDQSVSSMDM